MSTPNLTVYIQALGGKLLGPHSYYTANDGITVTLTYSGGNVNMPYPQQAANDGSPSTTYLPGATTPFPILTQQANGNPTVNYLTLPATSGGGIICAQATITSATPFEVGTLNISIPTPNGGPLILTEQVFLSGYNNGMQTVTVPVPGLLLVNGVYSMGQNSASVLVKMMCGCPIENNGTWPPADFIVQAVVTYNGSSAPAYYPMQFDGTTASLFTASGFGDPDQMTSVNIIAIQVSTGNFGCCVCDVAP